MGFKPLAIITVRVLNLRRVGRVLKAETVAVALSPQRLIALLRESVRSFLPSRKRGHCGENKQSCTKRGRWMV